MILAEGLVVLGRVTVLPLSACACVGLGVVV